MSPVKKLFFFCFYFSTSFSVSLSQTHNLRSVCQLLHSCTIEWRHIQRARDRRKYFLLSLHCDGLMKRGRKRLRKGTLAVIGLWRFRRGLMLFRTKPFEFRWRLIICAKNPVWRVFIRRLLIAAKEEECLQFSYRWLQFQKTFAASRHKTRRMNIKNLQHTLEALVSRIFSTTTTRILHSMLNVVSFAMKLLHQFVAASLLKAFLE